MNLASRDFRFAIRVRATMLAVVGALASIWWGAPAAHGAELRDQVRSLALVPADVAFYSASLRQKEQFDLFLASKAYSRLLEVPIVQLAKMQIGFQWQQSPQPVIAEARKYLESSEGKKVASLLKQMFSEETFVYASHDVIPAVEFLLEINSMSYSAQFQPADEEEVDEAEAAKKVSEDLRARVAELELPELVFGFRIEDKSEADAVLEHLEEVLTKAFEEHYPPLTEKLSRKTIGDSEFLILSVDGSMIPWDKIEEQQEESSVDEAEFTAWKELISKQDLVISLGVVGDFVLLSIGDSTDHLRAIGEGSSLASSDTLDRLEKHADERITSIGYASEQLMQAASSPERSLEDARDAIEVGLRTSEIGEEQRERLMAELNSLGADVIKYLPDPGAILGVTFLTPRGYEGYQYNLGTQPLFDSTSPLTILGHVGGNPLFVSASHSEQSIESYDKTIEAVKRVALQVETIAEEKSEPEDWAKYQEVRGEVIELLERLNRATRDKLLPALADGQQALVIDVGASSTRWFRAMPEARKPLPMLELGMSFSVSDAEKLREGVSEIVSIVEDGAALLHRVNPDDFSELSLPTAEVESKGSATLYTFPLPGKWGVDEQVAPNAGLADAAAAVSLMPAFTERLLESQPVTIDTSLDLDKPAAVVTHIQVAKLIHSVRPWLDYGLDVAMGNVKVAEDDADDEEGDEEGEEEELDEEDLEDDAEYDEEEAEVEEPVDPERQARIMQMGFVLPQVHQILNVLTAVQNVTSMTYEEDGAWVSHSETYLKDLE